MKKLLAFIISVIAILALTACGDDGVPDGMQLVSGSDAKGYYFYAPEGWIASETDGISAAYVSGVNRTSVTFTEMTAASIDKPADYTCGKEDCNGAALTPTEHYYLYHYFADTDFPESLTVVSEENIIFGKEGETADRCRKYEFSYVYKDHSFTDDGSDVVEEEVTCGFIQYFIVHDSSLYLMTYSGVKDVSPGLSTSYYEQYKEMLDSVVTNFRFVTKGEAADVEEEQITEEYRLVTDNRYAGFDFYAHKDFAVDYTSGIISVTHADGSNVNMSRASAVGGYDSVYIERRFEELKNIGAENITVVPRADEEGNLVTTLLPSKIGQVPQDNAQTRYDHAFDIEYTYTYNGETYHVYQIIAVQGNFISADGYVFTYTAKEANYAEHIDEVIAMRDKVRFV